MAKSPITPIRRVDSAVRYIERWGTPAERNKMSAAIRIEDPAQSRAAIVAVAEKVKERKRQNQSALVTIAIGSSTTNMWADQMLIKRDQLGRVRKQVCRLQRLQQALYTIREVSGADRSRAIDA